MAMNVKLFLVLLLHISMKTDVFMEDQTNAAMAINGMVKLAYFIHPLVHWELNGRVQAARVLEHVKMVSI